MDAHFSYIDEPLSKTIIPMPFMLLFVTRWPCVLSLDVGPADGPPSPLGVYRNRVCFCPCVHVKCDRSGCAHTCVRLYVCIHLRTINVCIKHAGRASGGGDPRSATQAAHTVPRASPATPPDTPHTPTTPNSRVGFLLFWEDEST